MPANHPPTLKKRVMLSWSSGKDSAWTLYQLQQDQNIEVMGLLTTFNQKIDRVAMHGVRRSLVQQQAAAAGLPLVTVQLPWPCSNEDYQTIMGRTLQQIKNEYAISHMAFGDLFLEDIRQYRVQQMQATEIDCLFPLWGLDTKQLAMDMIDGGLQAVVTCVDGKSNASALAGKYFTHKFLAGLPADIDPCGENGEFHSFVVAGPMFKQEIPHSVGETIERDGFFFTDVRPRFKSAGKA